MVCIGCTLFAARCSCYAERAARLCHSMSSVRPSVRDVHVPQSHRVEYFENNFTAARDPNIGDLILREHMPKLG